MKHSLVEYAAGIGLVLASLALVGAAIYALLDSNPDNDTTWLGILSSTLATLGLATPTKDILNGARRSIQKDLTPEQTEEIVARVRAASNPDAVSEPAA